MKLVEYCLWVLVIMFFVAMISVAVG